MHRSRCMTNPSVASPCCLTRGTDALAEVYQGTLRWALAHKPATIALAAVVFVASVFMVPLLGTEFVPKSDFSETNLSFNTPVGSSLEVTEARARQVEEIIRSFPEVRYTLTTINTGNAQGKMYASIYIRLVDRKLRQISVDEMSIMLRQRLRQVPGIAVTHVACWTRSAAKNRSRFRFRAPTWVNCPT
jgi:HAE1 family hydrophobic/amphiphilic exporter-1